MIELTFEERNLVCIYSGGGTRLGTIAALEDMRRYLAPVSCAGRGRAAGPDGQRPRQTVRHGR